MKYEIHLIYLFGAIYRLQSAILFNILVFFLKKLQKTKKFFGIFMFLKK